MGQIFLHFLISLIAMTYNLFHFSSSLIQYLGSQKKNNDLGLIRAIHAANAGVVISIQRAQDINFSY